MAPWAYGCAPDGARYTLAAVLLAVGALAPGPALGMRVACFGLAALGVVQVLLDSSAAPVQSLEASLVASAILVSLLFWVERGRSPRAATRLAGVVVAVCAAQAVFGVVQATLQPGRIYGLVSSGIHPFGSFVNHNHFAGLVEMGVFVGAGLLLGRLRYRRAVTPGTLALAGVCVGLLAAHLASGSRGGLLALLAGAAVFAIVASQGRRRTPWRGAVVAGVCLALTLAASFMVSPAVRSRLVSTFSGSLDASGRYRLDLAAASLRLFASRPFAGSGIGSYADAVTRYKRGHGEVRSTHAESDVLEQLAEGGILGMVLLVGVSTLLVQGAGARLRDLRDPRQRGLHAGVLGALAAIAVHSLFDFNMRIPSNALVAASLAGLSAAPMAPGERVARRRGGVLGRALLLGLAMAASWRALGALQLAEARARPGPEARLHALDPVTRLHPYSASAFRERGRAWRELAGRTRSLRPQRLERATLDLEEALLRRPSWGEAWAEKGWMRFLAGDLQAADRDLARAVELDPSHVRIGQARVRFFLVSARPGDAAREIDRLSRANPGSLLEGLVRVPPPPPRSGR